MTSRIKIRAGRMEIDYEGSEDFMRDELPKLIHSVASLVTSGNDDEIDEGDSLDVEKTKITAGTGGKLTGSTATLAAKLQVGSGPDLILASAAHLSFVVGQASFTRKQLTEQMKTATGFYKKTYMNNLSVYLQNLVKEQKLVEPASGTYALSSATRTSLEHRLGQ